jgi:serine protease Do
LARLDATLGVLVALLAAGCRPPVSGGRAAVPDHTGTIGPSAQPDATLSAADIAARSTKAVVSLHSDDTLGTGFIVRENGWIATNLHVIAVTQPLWAILADGRKLPVVEVVAASREHDLAIVRVEATGLPVLELADSDRVRPGDPVVVIGHPLGLEDTVSNGLVSATRHVADGLDVLQISAPIAPGSSGGPLFDVHGQVIGIAALIMHGGQNLNFALPANYLRALADAPQPVSMDRFRQALTELKDAESKRARQARHIPKYPPRLLDGCSEEALALLPQVLGGAIDVGAPLYNQGNFSACFQIYEGAAMDLERRLPKACPGPKRALAEGRARAAKLDNPSAQAWAMRDTFDGLFETLARRQR